MGKYVFVTLSMNARRQIYKLVKDSFDSRSIKFIYNEPIKWEEKNAKSNEWMYVPLIDANTKSDMILTQNISGNIFHYLNDFDANTIFWITNRNNFLRYKKKLKDWTIVYSHLEGGNNHFYYGESIIFFDRDLLMPYINREENFKRLYGTK